MTLTAVALKRKEAAMKKSKNIRKKVMIMMTGPTLKMIDRLRELSYGNSKSKNGTKTK
jgi:hypothetical protein